MSPTIKVIPISKIKIPHRLRQLDLEKDQT